jgi:Domain of unknown function (DUF4189)
MELKMSLKRALLGLFLVTAMSVPAMAETYKWGALALDTAKAEKEPAYGVGGGDDEKEASDIAMTNCKDAGGAQCTVATTYEQCGAIAVSGKGEAGWGKAPTKKDAEGQALQGCKGDSCSVVASDCNDE